MIDHDVICSKNLKFKTEVKIKLNSETFDIKLLDIPGFLHLK